MNYKNSHQQNDINQTLDLSQDYIAVAQNYLPNDILHHSQHHSHGIKKLDVNYAQSKDQNLIIQVYGDDASSSAQMQPIKYAEYSTHHNINEEGQMIVTNDDSDGDFDDLGDLHKTPSKHVKRNLPHKKRIAKKLNSNQPYTNEYSLIMPSSLPVAAAPLFECNICGAGIPDQLQFFVHLKGHYEPPQMLLEPKRRESLEVEEISMMEHRHQHQDSGHVVQENLIETLDESREHIKDEEIPPNVMDEFNEFSEPEDMMEDLRKEVEKVVETIADNDCDQHNWNYQVPDEIEEETDEPNDELQLYSENLIQSNPNSIESTYDEIDNNAAADNRGYDTEDDDDDVPLEQVKQSLQKFTKSEPETKKLQSEDDKEDMELTECLKKIHNFKCSILSCGKAFNSRTALGYHLKTHTTERRYVCDQVSRFGEVLDLPRFILALLIILIIKNCQNSLIYLFF